MTQEKPQAADASDAENAAETNATTTNENASQASERGANPTNKTQTNAENAVRTNAATTNENASQASERGANPTNKTQTNAENAVRTNATTTNENVSQASERDANPTSKTPTNAENAARTNAATTNENASQASERGANPTNKTQTNAENAPQADKTPAGANPFVMLGISEGMAERLSGAGISAPTAVQAQAVPHLLAGESVVFESETGTGKTLAYLLPIAERGGRAVVCAPTTELCSQIKAQAQAAALTGALVAGGSPLQRQAEALKAKPRVVVGSAARISELVALKKIKPREFGTLVLDEVDRLLSRELRDGTVRLVETFAGAGAAVVACSATVSRRSLEILSEAAGRELRLLRLPPEDVLRRRILHLALFAERRDKIDSLRKLLAAEKPAKALVFTSRADQVENITSKLKYRNVECDGLHAKAGKVQRKSAIDRFRSGKLRVLVTSDLSARGLDIPGITHVVQMDLPEDIDFFVHRAGRTARAGRTGTNVVVGDEFELRRLAQFERRLKITVHPRELRGGRLVMPAQDAEGTGAAGPSAEGAGAEKL